MDKSVLYLKIFGFRLAAECYDRPSLTYMPIAIYQDLPLKERTVLSANAEAHLMGVRSGDSLVSAMQKCPDLILLPLDDGKCRRFSEQIMALLTDFTPQVQEDIPGTYRITVPFSVTDAVPLANRIREQLERDFSLTVSVGISDSHVLAELACSLAKEGTVTELTKDMAETVLNTVSVQYLPEVGTATAARLKELGILTVGDLAAAGPLLLKRELGDRGVRIHGYACGSDGKRYTALNQESMENAVNPEKPIDSPEDAAVFLYILAETLSKRLKTRGKKTQRVIVELHGIENDLTVIRQKKLTLPANDLRILYGHALPLLQKAYKALPGGSVASLCLRLDTLIDGRFEQMSFSVEAEDEQNKAMQARIREVLRQYHAVPPEDKP